jgi:C-terminal processing protease CtpA/Prc
VKKAALLLAVFVLAFARSAAPKANAASAPVSSETRLLGAMKLWGDIRFFDPQVSEGSVDWDAAFINAEPAIMAATDRASYGAAISGLLSPLHDLATQVITSQGGSFARMTVSLSGSASVIAIEHGTSGSSATYQSDTKQAVTIASKSRVVLFDLRGVTEGNPADDATLEFFASTDSPIAGLLSGDVALPRERSRSYLGYPDDSGGGYEGYSALDWTADPTTIPGTLKQPIRLGFLVDASTSLPPIAIALASAGTAAIYSTHGQPAVLSAGSEVIDLPHDVQVAYRDSDLADFAERQSFASSSVPTLPDALSRLQRQAPVPATFATAPPEKFANKPYAGQLFPPEPMRMLAVARVYNVVRYFSPYRALMHDDWDAAALQAIRDERAATNARSYVLGLMKFYAHLHDSHGLVFGKTIETEFGAGPPFRARYLHRQVVVTQVFADKSAMRGIRVGDVIDAIDGVPARQAMDRAKPYICSSTPQSANATALAPIIRPSVFAGRRGTAFTLRFHHPDQPAALTTSFVRNVYRVTPPTSPKYIVLPGNVGYVAFDQLEQTEVDAMFSALKNTRAIIFDNRGYPKGTAWSIAPRLTTRTSVRLALFNTPLVIDSLDAQEGEITPLPAYREFYQMMDAAQGPRYLKPTVMLIDERAISQSEHSGLFLRGAGHTRFVGTPTAGANGDVTSMVAPGDLTLYFSGEGVRWPDGKQLQRVGLIPDVRVEPTALDIATGNDVVLQRGLDEALRLTGATKSQRAAAVRQEIARERTMSP